MVSKTSSDVSVRAQYLPEAVKGALPLEVVQTFTDPESVRIFFESQGSDLSTGDEISDGYETLDDKGRLINTALIVIDWTFHESSEHSGSFVSARVMDMNANKYRISDGSSGIFTQLGQVTEHRLSNPQKGRFPQAGLVVQNGLRVSEFWVSNATGRAITDEVAATLSKDEKKKARTYYLDL